MSKVDLCQQCKSPVKQVCTDMPHLCGQLDNQCFSCSVGFYSDYDPRYCKDAKISGAGCENWRASVKTA